MNNIYVVMPESASGDRLCLYNDKSAMIEDLCKYAQKAARLYFEIEGLIVKEAQRDEHSGEPIPEFIARDFVEWYCEPHNGTAYEYGPIKFDGGKSMIGIGGGYERHPYTDIPEVRDALYQGALDKIKEMVAVGDWEKWEDI